MINYYYYFCKLTQYFNRVDHCQGLVSILFNFTPLSGVVNWVDFPYVNIMKPKALLDS